MLTANQKYIDTANIKHLLAAGEKNIDRISIAVDRYYQGTDLSECLFTLRAINSSGGLILQNLEKESTTDQIILTWTVDETFTAVPGALALEIVCQNADVIVLKYEMSPMIVRGSILEQYEGGIDAIDKALQEMQSVLAQAEAISVKLPLIQNGTWWLYDVEAGVYVDSGQAVQGEKGDKGDTGEQGVQGEKGDTGAAGKDGENGYSPTATVVKTDGVVTITMTDQNGTTSASITEGADVDLSDYATTKDLEQYVKETVMDSTIATVKAQYHTADIALGDRITALESVKWGDFDPEANETTWKYCSAKLTTNANGEQTWLVNPTLSDSVDNALSLIEDGLYISLSEYATKTYVENTIAGVEKNITTLGDGLSTETMNRVNADTALDTRITALESADYGTQIENLATTTKNLANTCSSVDASLGTYVNATDNRITALETRIAALESSSGKSSTRTILFDSSNQDSIYLQYNSTTYSLSDFISTHADFLSDSALNYSTSVFGWDAQIYTCSNTVVALTADSYIALRYLSGSTETGILRLVSASSEKTASEILTAAQTDGSYTDLSLQWLYSTDSVTVLSPCTGITAGKYYVVWVGRSNNSHPLISEVSVW